MSRDNKDAYLYKLRKNNILNWISDLEEINTYKSVLTECTPNSTLSIESGIVKISPSNRYISHKYVPHVKHGFNFQELSIIMKYKIIEFEDKYGEVNLSDNELYELKQIVYEYNRILCSDLNMEDKKKLIHLEQSAEVLHYLLTPSVVLNNLVNGWCNLTFTNGDMRKKDYCTIFTYEQINILEKVNKSIQLNLK